MDAGRSKSNTFSCCNAIVSGMAGCSSRHARRLAHPDEWGDTSLDRSISPSTVRGNPYGPEWHIDRLECVRARTAAHSPMRKASAGNGPLRPALTMKGQRRGGRISPVGETLTAASAGRPFKADLLNIAATVRPSLAPAMRVRKGSPLRVVDPGKMSTDRRNSVRPLDARPSDLCSPMHRLSRMRGRWSSLDPTRAGWPGLLLFDHRSVRHDGLPSHSREVKTRLRQLNAAYTVLAPKQALRTPRLFRSGTRFRNGSGRLTH
jgi:hypothetical protein